MKARDLVRLRRARRPLLAVLFGLALAGIAGSALWGAFGSTPAGEVRFSGGIESVADPAVGIVNRKSSVARQSAAIGERVIYAVDYRIDEFGRRITAYDGPTPAARHALFFGGSFTFGIGVGEDETIPAQFGKLRPDLRAYNYGVTMHGPANALALAQSRDLAGEVEGEGGVAVFTFINNHLARTVWHSSLLRWRRAANFPRYRLTADDRLIRDGNLDRVCPWYKEWPLRVLWRTGFADRLGLGEWAPTPDDFRLTARVLAALRDTVETQLPGTPLVVVFFPNERMSLHLVPLLEKEHVAYLNYTSLLPFEDPRYANEADGHPTALTDGLLAEKLVKDLADRGLLPPVDDGKKTSD